MKNTSVDSLSSLIGSVAALALMTGIALGMALGAAAYVVSPVDIIPDFIPVAGQIDDVVVGGGGMAMIAALYLAAKRTGLIDRAEAVALALVAEVVDDDTK